MDFDPAVAGGLDVTERVFDWAAFAHGKLVRTPFEYLIVPEFVRRDIATEAGAGFPRSDLPGVLPAPAEPPDNAFGRILRAIRNPRTTDAFGQKFGLALEADALMVTLRARTRPDDGRIHTDSETKVVTALLYLNDGWSEPGGRLRLLHGPDDIEDMAAEVAPLAGTLLAFRRSAHSWHGHTPFAGERRAIMFNWMVDAATARRELRRHALSAGLKSLFA
jgi:SM-20-related protein